MGKGLPLVSVIVPTRNSDRTLERCLSAVRDQTYPNVEIVTVDTQSTDKTLRISSKLADIVRYIDGERSEAKNMGARESHGAYLLFLDSDMYLSRRVIEECANLAAQRLDGTAIIIPEAAIGAGFWARCRALEKECYWNDDAIEAARFLPRGVFMDVGGFDTSLGPAGEDWDLDIRIRRRGHSFARIHSLVYHDEGRLTLAGAIKKKFYYGSYLRRFSNRYGRDARMQLSPWRAAYFRNVRKVLRDPMVGAGLLVLKASEYLAVTIGMAKSSLGQHV